MELPKGIEMEDLDARVRAFGKCDVCGEQATSLATDVVRTEDTGSFYTFAPVGRTKRGCDEHPATSVQHVSRPSLRF